MLECNAGSGHKEEHVNYSYTTTTKPFPAAGFCIILHKSSDNMFVSELPAD